MKQVGASIFAVLLCLLGFRLVSPAPEAVYEPTHYIAYLLAKGTDFEADSGPSAFLSRDLPGYKIKVFYSWRELVDSNSKYPFDALVIHASALPMVDFEWMATAYWRGVTISTIDIYPSMLAHLLDDGCLPYGDTMPIPDDGPYVTVSTNLILSLHDQTQVVKWFRRDWRRNCDHIKPVEAVKATVASARYTSGPIDDREFLESILIGHIEAAQDERDRFIEEYGDPQFLGTRLSR